jgi:putative transposase
MNMASTRTEVYIHFVFAVSGRENAITSELRESVHRYITGVVQNNKHTMMAINSHFDHVHMLIGLHSAQAIADLMRDVKANSSRFISETRKSSRKFAWQEGYGAFSYSKSQCAQVIKYIEGQEEHHRGRSFREEYIEILKRYDPNIDEMYYMDAYWNPDEEATE